MASDSPRLRRKLLKYLLIPLGLLWLVSAVMALYFARNYANVAFDSSLFDTAETLGGQILLQNGRVVVDLPDVARHILEYDSVDKLYLQVRRPDGELVYGDESIPLPPMDKLTTGRPFYYDATINREAVRVAADLRNLAPRTGGYLVLVQVAETRRKRNALTSEILSEVLVPVLVLVAFAGISVWVGVGRGLQPLDAVADAIDRRSPRDLTPVRVDDAPAEVLPLLDAINRLFHRVDLLIQAQQRFISNAAHQLRTPLAGLRAQMDLALREQGYDRLRYTLEQMSSAMDHTTRVVQQLLTLARSEAAPGSSLRIELLDLDRLAHETTAEWVPRAMKKGVDLGYEAPDGRATISGVATLLKELLGNIIDNAIRYADRGACVTVRVEKGKDGARLSVEDNGPGIPVDQRELVFERFYRVLGTHGEGSGLGLAIVAEIARMHDAQVSLATPAQGRGTRVEIRFPPASTAGGRIGRTVRA